MSEWKSASHNKYLLQYHLIFVCKYRKKLLVSQNIADDVKRLSIEICNKHRVNIKYMGKILRLLMQMFLERKYILYRRLFYLFSWQCK